MKILIRISFVFFLFGIFLLCGCKGSNRDESSGDSRQQQSPKVEATCSQKIVTELRESCSQYTGMVESCQSK